MATFIKRSYREQITLNLHKRSFRNHEQKDQRWFGIWISKLTSTLKNLIATEGGITGHTKQQAYIMEWELVYREVLKISRCFNNLTRSDVAEADAAPLNKELRNKNILE